MSVWLKISILLLVAALSQADYRNILRLCKVDCDFNPDLMYNYSCKVRAISRIRTALYFDLHLRRPTTDVLVNLQIFKKNSIQYIPYMVNISFNACSVLEGKQTSWVAKFVYEWLSPYSNFNHTCPYSGYVFVKQMEPFADNIPGFVSVGDYRMDVHWYEKTFARKNWLGTVRGYGTMAVKPFITQNVQ